MSVSLPELNQLHSTDSYRLANLPNVRPRQP